MLRGRPQANLSSNTTKNLAKNVLLSGFGAREDALGTIPPNMCFEKKNLSSD